MSFGRSFLCWQRCRVGTQPRRGWPDSRCFCKATRFLSSAGCSQQTRRTRKVAALMKKSSVFREARRSSASCSEGCVLMKVSMRSPQTRGCCWLEREGCCRHQTNFGGYPNPPFAAGTSLICWEGNDGGKLHDCNTRVAASGALGRRRCCGKQFVFGQ